MIPPCLTLSNIRYVSRVKWSNPDKGVAPFPTPQCNSYWKGSLLVTLNYSCQQLYHGYINVNINPWWMRIQLNIFVTSKQPNKVMAMFFLWNFQKVGNERCFDLDAFVTHKFQTDSIEISGDQIIYMNIVLI